MVRMLQVKGKIVHIPAKTIPEHYRLNFYLKDYDHPNGYPDIFEDDVANIKGKLLVQNESQVKWIEMNPPIGQIYCRPEYFAQVKSFIENNKYTRNVVRYQYIPEKIFPKNIKERYLKIF